MKIHNYQKDNFSCEYRQVFCFLLNKQAFTGIVIYRNNWILCENGMIHSPYRISEFKIINNKSCIERYYLDGVLINRRQVGDRKLFLQFRETVKISKGNPFV